MEVVYWINAIEAILKAIGNCGIILLLFEYRRKNGCFRYRGRVFSVMQ